MPSSPFWRCRAERRQCMSKFQHQKKSRCHAAASISSRNVDMPFHLQGRCVQHQLPWPFYFQSHQSDSPDLTCFHKHFLLSSCTAAFGCHKVIHCQLCHSCLHLCPSLPAPLDHYLLKFLLQATFLHPTTFLTLCLLQPSTNPSTFSLPRHNWKYIPLIFLVSVQLVSLWPPL